MNIRRNRNLIPLLIVGTLVGCGEPVLDEPPSEPIVERANEGEPFDRTAASGIVFRHDSGDPLMDNIIESLGSGAVWLDIDGDQDVDLYLINQSWLEGISSGEEPGASPQAALFENLGDGSFRDITNASGLSGHHFGYSAAAGDVDGDGDTDLYLANCGPNLLYLNRGDGTFEPTEGIGVDEGRCSAGATFLDYDRDGQLDLFVANYLTFDPDYKLHYAPDVYPGPLAYEAEGDALLRNRGDGTFEDVSSEAGIGVPPGRAMGVVATDFDLDGWTDVFVANDGTQNFLFRNRGDGTFEEVGVASGTAFGFQGEATGAMAGVVGDLDGDGRPDLLVTDTTYGSLYRNLGEGIFEDRVMSSGLAAPSGQWVSWGGGFFDYDDDGDLDVFQVNGDLKRPTGRPDLLLENLGEGAFEVAEGGAYFRAELLGRGGAFADYDNDGDLDVLVTILGDRPVLLRNDFEDQNHWLGIRLVGKQSPRDGFGAVVRLKADDREWTRIHHAAAGYLTQGDPRMHFGLGSMDRVDLEVTWPSGVVDRQEEIAVDRYLTLEEGSSEP